LPYGKLSSVFTMTSLICHRKVASSRITLFSICQETSKARYYQHGLLFFHITPDPDKKVVQTVTFEVL